MIIRGETFLPKGKKGGGIGQQVQGGLGVVIVIIALVMIAQMPFASAIQTELTLAAAGAAGFLTLYFFLWMLKNIETIG